MIVIQDENKNVIACETTLTKALTMIKMTKYRFRYVNTKLRESGKLGMIIYKGYIISKW